MGMAPGSRPTCDMFDLGLLERLDAEFEDYQREVRGTSEAELKMDRDFCFQCAYCEDNAADGDEEMRRMAEIAREFNNFVNRRVAKYAIVEAVRKIKIRYERETRQLIVAKRNGKRVYQPSYTYKMIAKHILHHDATVENAVALDGQVHMRLMASLRDNILEKGGGVNAAALKDYITLSNNFHRHIAATKKKAASGGLL